MTIIGLMGKARAGKDSVGQIIKRIVPGAETIALADPIKTIGKKLFAFNDEQCFGDQKETPDRRFPRKCETCGGKGYLTKPYDQDAHIDLACLDCTPGLPPNAKDDWRLRADVHGIGIRYLTPRWAFQYIGTEVARALYEDTWLDYGLRTADDLKAGKIYKLGPDLFESFVQTDGTVVKYGAPKCTTVAITDVRFINEARKIYTRPDGLVLRVRRPSTNQLDAQSQAHQSEREMENPEIEKYIHADVFNNGTLQDLETNVRIFLHTFNIRTR